MPDEELIAVMLPRGEVRAWADSTATSEVEEMIKDACKLALTPRPPRDAFAALIELTELGPDRTHPSLVDAEDLLEYLIHAMREIGDSIDD